jgi:hypothetical protein
MSRFRQETDCRSQLFPGPHEDLPPGDNVIKLFTDIICSCSQSASV